MHFLKRDVRSGTLTKARRLRRGRPGLGYPWKASPGVGGKGGALSSL